MSMRDALIGTSAELPDSLREPIAGVSFADYLFVEASRLDGLSERDVLRWLGIREAAFARAEGPWSNRVNEELARDGSGFDELYQELLGRALSAWGRSVSPLDRDVAAWVAFQQHTLAAADPDEVPRRAGLTPGDEMRLARLWRQRLADPEIAARAAAAMARRSPPLPAIDIAPFVFPPDVQRAREAT